MNKEKIEEIARDVARKEAKEVIEEELNTDYMFRNDGIIIEAIRTSALPFKKEFNKLLEYLGIEWFEEEKEGYRKKKSKNKSK